VAPRRADALAPLEVARAELATAPAAAYPLRASRLPVHRACAASCVTTRGPLTQSVECHVHSVEVAGSNPAWPTTLNTSSISNRLRQVEDDAPARGARRPRSGEGHRRSTAHFPSPACGQPGGIHGSYPKARILATASSETGYSQCWKNPVRSRFTIA